MTDERKADLEEMTSDALQNKIEEVRSSIQNEKMWMFGSDNIEDELMHSNNVDELREELRYILDLIDEKEKQ
jgi:hypothetical protein